MCYHIFMKEGELQFFDFFEKNRNHTPTPEEVYSVFQELVGGEYKLGRMLGDDRGLYLLEITVPGAAPDETIEYAYMRQGHYKEGGITTTEIHITYYKNGKPVSGTSAARLTDGKWQIL